MFVQYMVSVIITPFDTFEIQGFGKYYGKYFPYYFENYLKNINFLMNFFSMCLKIENDVMI